MSVIRLTISYPGAAGNIELVYVVFVAKPRLIRHIPEDIGREMVVLCRQSGFRIAPKHRNMRTALGGNKGTVSATAHNELAGKLLDCCSPVR